MLKGDILWPKNEIPKGEREKGERGERERKEREREEERDSQILKGKVRKEIHHFSLEKIWSYNYTETLDPVI